MEHWHCLLHRMDLVIATESVAKKDCCCTWLAVEYHTSAATPLLQEVSLNVGSEGLGLEAVAESDIHQCCAEKEAEISAWTETPDLLTSCLEESDDGKPEAEGPPKSELASAHQKGSWC